MLHPSDQLTYLTGINPVSQGAGTVDTGWVSAAGFAAFLAVIQAGVLGAAATLDAKVQQATDVGGTGVKDVTGKAITQMVKATDDNKVALINFRPPELDVAGGFGFVRVRLTVGTAASLVAAVLYGVSARAQPAAQAAAVKETVG